MKLFFLLKDIEKRRSAMRSSPIRKGRNFGTVKIFESEKDFGIIVAQKGRENDRTLIIPSPQSHNIPG